MPHASEVELHPSASQLAHVDVEGVRNPQRNSESGFLLTAFEANDRTKSDPARFGQRPLRQIRSLTQSAHRHA
jgi:hypothetical protein